MNATNYQLAISALTNAVNNADGDHPQPQHYWPLLAAAAIHALLAIVDEIGQSTNHLEESLPMAGKGN